MSSGPCGIGSVYGTGGGFPSACRRPSPLTLNQGASAKDCEWAGNTRARTAAAVVVQKWKKGRRVAGGGGGSSRASGG